MRGDEVVLSKKASEKCERRYPFVNRQSRANRTLGTSMKNIRFFKVVFPEEGPGNSSVEPMGGDSWRRRKFIFAVGSDQQSRNTCSLGPMGMTIHCLGPSGGKFCLLSCVLLCCLLFVVVGFMQLEWVEVAEPITINGITERRCRVPRNNNCLQRIVPSSLVTCSLSNGWTGYTT